MDMDETSARIREALASAKFKRGLRKKHTKRLRRAAKTSFEIQVPAIAPEPVADTPPPSLRRRGA